MEGYTAKTRAAVKCQFCPATACRPCQQRSLLSSYTDPCCYACKAGWSADFLAANFPLSFRNDTLRKHRRKVLLEREKSMLPAMVVFVEAKKNITRSNALFLEADALLHAKHGEFRVIRARLDAIYPRYSTLRMKRDQGILIDTDEVTEYRRLRNQVKKFREEEAQFNEHEVVPAHKAVQTLRREVARWHQVYATGEDPGTGGAAKEKRQFIMRCPAEGCRGFLSQTYVCGVCEKKTCSECLELLPGDAAADSGAENHKCKPETVESAKAIKKETRPCPKCGARIFKIDGCFAKDTPILLWNGRIKMSQDIRVGDELVGDDGQKRIVEETCSGGDEMYEVLQRDGMNYIVNSKHKLCLKFSSEKKIHYSETEDTYVVRWFDRERYTIRTKKGSEEELNEFINTLTFDEVIEITVDDYVNLSDSAKQHLMGFKATGIHWPKQEVKLDPYVLGLWLGDGINNGTSFAIAPDSDPEILKYLLDWCKQNDAELIHDEAYRFRIRQREVAFGRLAIGRGATSAECKGCKEKKCSLCDLPNEPYETSVETGKRNPMKATLDYYHELKDKHIPLEYLVNDRDTRLKLLAGIIDTDGCVSANGKRIQIPQVRHGLALQIGFLARSLGFIVHLDTVKKFNVPFPGAVRKDYRDQTRVSISGTALSEIPCLVARKKCVDSQPNKDWLRTRIEVIPLGQGTYYGWKVSDNKRFLLADTTVLRNCDQMYCTMEGCGTAFSWTSGQIVTGRIHNPHYYEWLRRNNGGTAPRDDADIPCGGIPVAWAYTRSVIRYMGLTTEQKNLLLEIHRNMVEFEQRLRDYPATRPAVANKEINVLYLMNEITEPEWQRQLELNEAKFNRKKEIGQILQTLVTAGAEVLQGIMERLNGVGAADWIRDTALPMLESLRVYTNDAYKALAKAQHMAVPQISEKWGWQGIRALYRGAKGTTDGDDAASVPPPLIEDEAVAVV